MLSAKIEILIKSTSHETSEFPKLNYAQHAKKLKLLYNRLPMGMHTTPTVSLKPRGPSFQLTATIEHIPKENLNYDYINKIPKYQP